MSLTDARHKRRFNEMIVPHLNDALSLARWLTGNAADAEDVVQDACIRAFKALDQCAEGKARGWLLAIVRNCAFTWMARNRPKLMIVTDDVQTLEGASATMPIDTSTPETELIAKADSEMLNAAIANLPPHFRETFVLREVSDFSYREIAEIVAVPIGTVMSRLARARALLIADLTRRETANGDRP